MDLTPELLLTAYASGVFPMAEHRDDPEVFWVDPKRRGVFLPGGFHLSRSLARQLRRGGFRVSLDDDFAAVVSACADRSETWINDTIFELYMALHDGGRAHSLEVRDDADRLIGGVYGVALGAAFFGESMFSRAADGSKIALAFLTTHLDACGFTLFDTQFLTPHLASLGALEIPRGRYRSLLAEALEEEASIHAKALPSTDQVLQRRTQKS
ncbi:leucyl/phenylalanyl-tRNA--protein transferase [Poseidonocella sedimentorum]|nr:leucyl/phenylalanyl-tRNA--protein transferase [Poseidonocella sedimentorum]